MMVIAAPEGYKTSTVGIIPNNWECRMLQNGLSAKPEYGANASAMQPVTNDFIRYIRITDIDESGRLIQDGAKALSEDEAEGFILEEDDILIARTGNTVGKSMRYTEEMGLCAFAGYLIRFKLDANKLQPKFVSQFLRSDIFWEWVQKSIKVGAQPNINAQQYQAMPIVFPPLPEQKKIARILSSVDSKLALIDQQITTTQTLKKGLMQKLFTQGVGTQDADGRWQPHTEFQKTELGRIPTVWEVVELQTLAHSISVGIATSTTSHYVSKGTPLIRNQNILPDQLNDEDLLYISEEFDQKNRNKRLHSGDVLTVRTGYPGITCVVPEKYVGAHTFTTLITRPKQEYVCSEYLSRYFNSPKGNDLILGRAAGGAQQNINAGSLKNLLVPLPTLQEQQEIARILSTVDRKLDHLQSQKTQTQQLKKGLMQKLLTGQIRVQPDPQDN